MARRDTTLDEILVRVVDRLIQKLAISPETCYVGLLNQAPEYNVAGDYWIVVSAGDGEFDAEQFAGGGDKMATERFNIVVTVYTSVGNLDEQDRAVNLTLERSFGLRKLQRGILRALLVDYDLQAAGGDALLRSMLSPVQETGPLQVDDTMWSAAVVFLAEYDWDLSEPEDE